MDREGVDRAFLVGLSMGGMTAMRLALRTPARVAGMVLIDSNADVEEGGKRAQYAVMGAIYRRFGLFGPLARVARRDAFGRSFIAWPYTPYPSPFHSDPFFEETRLADFCMRAKGYELVPVEKPVEKKPG